ncbi:unnamed protein product [Brassica napus]|uniref:(rape) hypothetical protein n=1 Tax=Brassica napus TaxID=3708 RepID=A0A816VUK1_BRANA|nr:unnamed protein product [Brassica napus]
MYTKKFLLIVCLVLSFSFGFVSAQICGESLFFRPTSTYAINRLLVLSTLASNVSSREGYYNASVGEGPGRIYALGLCLPGTDPTVCSDCIQLASVSLLQNCPNQTNSWFWRSEDDTNTICFVRYSNRSFFNQIDLRPREEFIYDLDFIGDVAKYKRTWGGFMERMISAASSSSPGSLAGRHYAANTTSLSGSRTIYALMQCIPGISSADCNACLQENVRYYQSCCGGKQGGSVRRPVCFFRFDLYWFRNAFHNIASSPPPQSSQDGQELQPTTPPPPPPDGKTISTGVRMALIVSTGIFIALLALGLFVFKRRQSYNTLNLETIGLIDISTKAKEVYTLPYKVINKRIDIHIHIISLSQKMWLNSLFSILCLALAVSFDYVSAVVCGDSMFFTPNGTYDTNRRLVLATLASNVISQDGYYNVSVGEGPGMIYALGMCIPGTEPQTCSDCIQASSKYLLQDCQNQTDSYDWSPPFCYVRYSNSSFYNEITLKPQYAEYYTGDIPGNVTEFNRLWEDLMRRMITATSSSTPGSPARRHYTVDMIPFTGFVNIYALMQCIPWISSEDCQKCLLENVRRQQNCCSKYKGGSVRRPVCYSLTDTSPFFGAFDNITLSPPPQGPLPQAPRTSPPLGDLTKKDGKTISTRTIVAIVVPVAIIVLLLALGFTFYRRRKSYKPMKLQTNDIFAADDDMTNTHQLQYDLNTIEAATDNFSDENKLGEGGFGVVYKGTFSNGTEIAVKRLTRTSRQGFQEFKNEVVVVAKLQHNNLVRLLGFCMEREEKILVYEFLCNKSLDMFLFDTTSRPQLDWPKRYNIIEGIARGILYLHRDSRPKVIHRDLKASNILLDAGMNPKIADFGLAKIFAVEQTRDETSRIAGTYGYMAPEYMNLGQFSMESDVYSFGVLVLEIISGHTSSRFYRIGDTDCNLVTYAWKIWRTGSYAAEEFVDPTLGDNYQIEQVTRCIHIALLCVQADHADRPKICKINSMLTSSKISLPAPHEPGFLVPSRRA